MLTFPLPRGLTEEHGPVEVQLSVYEETESGWQLKYTPIITPLLHISKSIPSPLDEIPEDVSKGLLVDMTQLADVAEESAQAAENAAENASTMAEAAQRSLSQAQTAAEDARAAAVEAQTSATDCNEVRDEVEELSGIAADILAMTGVGDGIHHPCVTVDVALNAESDNPVTNRAVTNEFLRADADVRLKLQGKAEKQHTHAATDVITSIGDTVEDTLMGLQARKAENSALIAENIAYSYGVDDTFDTVADALTYLLGKSGLL